jgi:glycerol-3-phosphate acyltransferase PlsY
MMPSILPEPSSALLHDPLAWAWIAAAYLLGAVPFGLLISRRVKGVDLRTIGSGNIGATNAIRAMGRGWGYAVFALDFLKGALPVLLAPPTFGASRPGLETLQVVAGAAATLGHCYPVYLRFQGGKGVATGCGAVVTLDWPTFLSGGAVWLATRLASGYAGLASILMGLAFPVAVLVLHGTERSALLTGAVLLAILILVRHRSNIQRMLSGTEPNARDRDRPTGDPPRMAPHG